MAAYKEILKHNNRMGEIIYLNKVNSALEFQLNSKDSSLLIQSVTVTSSKNGVNQWTNFISKIKLIAELKYVVYTDPEGRYFDERKKQFPIHFLTDLRQVQPIFHLNEIIKNETFTLGINPERKFYRTLKLALQNVESLEEDYILEFSIEKFNIA